MSLVVFLILGLGTSFVSSVCVDVDNLQMSSAALQQCLMDVTEEAKLVTDNPAVPTTTFTTYIDLEYQTMTETFDFCCEEYMADGIIAQMRQDTVSPKHGDMRVPPEVTFVHANSGDDADSSKFLIVKLDLELANNTPFLYWLMYNVPGNNASQGDVGMPYQAPLGPNRVIVLLYKQSSDINVFDITDYVDLVPMPCGNARCSFNATKLASDYSLTLVGSNWAKLEQTNYAYYLETLMEDYDPVEHCTGRPNVESVDADGANCMPVDNTGNGANGQMFSSIIIMMNLFLLKNLI